MSTPAPCTKTALGLDAANTFHRETSEPKPAVALSSHHLVSWLQYQESPDTAVAPPRRACLRHAKPRRISVWRENDKVSLCRPSLSVAPQKIRAAGTDYGGVSARRSRTGRCPAC